MIRKSIVLISLILFLKTGSAQDFLEGYLVKAQGDTLKGYISQRFQVRKEIRFKADPNSKDFQTFMPSDLIASYLKPNNEYYISRTLDIDMKSTDIRSLDSDDPSPIWVNTTILLKVLMKGKASLYTYQDNQKQHFFFQIERGAIRELMNIHYMDTKTNSEVLIEGFKHQMKGEMAGCKINYDQVYYYESSLLKAFKKYNECVHAPITLSASQPGTKKSWYLLAGASIGLNSTYKGADIPVEGLGYLIYVRPNALKYSASTNALFGVGLNIQSARPDSHYSLGTELLFRYFSAEGASDYSPISLVTCHTTASYQFSATQLNILVQRSFGNSLKPFVNLGISVNYFTKNSSQYTATGTEFGTPFAINTPVNNFDALSVGYFGSAGMTYQRFIFTIRGEFLPANASGSASAQFSAVNLNLMAGYRLF